MSWLQDLDDFELMVLESATWKEELATNSLEKLD